MNQIFIKAGVTLLAMSLWFLTQKYIGRSAPKNSSKIKDSLHELTAGWNQKLNKSKKLSNFLLLSSSLVIDALGIYLIAKSIFGETIQPLLNIILVFTLRQINQVTTRLPVPEGMVWHNPGFPSIFVTYDVASDLFFSGHTALATLGALELMNLGHPLFWVLGFLIAIYEVAVVIVLRAHWTMDIFTGVIVALWIYYLATPLAQFLDSWIHSFA